MWEYDMNVTAFHGQSVIVPHVSDSDVNLPFSFAAFLNQIFDSKQAAFLRFLFLKVHSS